MHAVRRLVATSLAALAAGVLALPAAAGARPAPRPVTITFWVPVKASDDDGRIVAFLFSGQWARISATGQADCNVNDNSEACTLDADGSDALAPTDWYAQGMRQFSLIGRVGDGPLVQLGTQPTQVSGSGAVRVTYNDLLGAYEDDGGGFLVKVTQCLLRCG